MRGLWYNVRMKRKGTNLSPPLPLLVALAFSAIAWTAHALPAVRPALPPVASPDTETVTNLAFTAWERGLHEFRFDLSFAGTASNNVEIAFGTDANGDGKLSDGEVALLAGWDCGELFVADNATDERFAEAAADGDHAFSLACEMRSSGRIVSVAFADNGSPVFPELAATRPSWLHSSDWDMVRLTGRGENVRSGERFSAKIASSGGFFLLR